MAETEEIIVTLVVNHRDSYVVEGFALEEALSEVPVYEVTILDQTSLLSNFLGAPCEIQLVQEVYANAKPRTFAGIIMSVERTVATNGSPTLKLVVQPSIAALSLSVGSAVYENKTCIDILKEVMNRNKVAVTLAGAKSSSKRPVVIQYNENDLTFVRRILLEEGMVMLFNIGFKSDDTRESVSLVNVMAPFPKNPAVIMLTDAEMSDVDVMEAHTLTLQRKVRPGRVELTTYNPKDAIQATGVSMLPTHSKASTKSTIIEHVPVTVPVGTVKGTAIKLAAAAAARPELGLTGTCEHPGVHLGQTLDIASEGHSEISGKYIVVRLRYRPVRGNALVCNFDAVPVSHAPVFDRPQKPVIAGVHNAIVIGGASSKAGDPFCDAQGRVHVKFFWDPEGKNTVWLRVSEPYAGKGYGTQFIPRVGHEVLVSFLHGDPDAPIITGQVYTEKHKHPFMEKNTTRSGIRSELNGEPNEWEFDDKAGAEMVAVRAARDYRLIVNNDVLRDIKKFETTKIGETCKLEINQDFITDVTNAIIVKGKSRSIKIRNNDDLSAKNITIGASSKITFKVGSSKIEMTSSGISITAAQITEEASGKMEIKAKGPLLVGGMKVDVKAKTALALQGLKVDMKASTMLNVQGALSDIKGSGMLKLQGGVCMIN
jgi:type VI secretion system secreted protein VgrG